jgi:hypothetical protein
MYVEYRAKMSIGSSNARDERVRSLAGVRQWHLLERGWPRYRKEGRMVKERRCWLTAALISFLIVAFLVTESNLLLGRAKNKVQGTIRGSIAPLGLQHFAPATGPLYVDPSNPRYFTDGSGKAILLAGSHTWFTMQDAGATDPPPVFDYDAFLDFVEGQGHNFFRTFVWEQSWKAEGGDFDARVLPNIYARTGPGIALDGHPRFDLTQFNQAYFDRIRARAIEAGQRGFYVSLMLFEGFSVQDKHGTGYSPYPGHPYNPANNINGIDGDPYGTGDGGQIQTLNIPAITALQEAYVRKLIDTVNDLDNVLFEICNESEANPDNIRWQNHFIDYVHSYEAGKPKQHPVGFTVPWPGGNNAVLFASHADWVSPNGGGGYDSNPPANDGRKVIISDTDHIWGLGGSADWAWKSFTRGLNPIFMDPYDDYAKFIWTGLLAPDDPTSVRIRANLGYILSYANRMNLAAMVPRADLCSSGYCLANPVAGDAEYLVYLPSGGTVTVDLSATPGELSVEWFNPSTGETVAEGTLVGSASGPFIAPFSGNAVLYIYGTETPALPTQTPITAPEPTPAPDKQPPVITNVTANPLDVSAVISWTTDEPATSQVSFGITSTTMFSTPLEEDLLRSHTVILTDLIPDTSYSYQVRSNDANGNSAVSQIESFSTRASKDVHRIYVSVILRLAQSVFKAMQLYCQAVNWCR